MAFQRSLAPLALAAVLLLLVGAHACNDDGAYCRANAQESCLSNTDCRRRYAPPSLQFDRACIEGLCVPKQCGSIGGEVVPCPTDQNCQDGICMERGNEFDPCNGGSDSCAGDLECGPTDGRDGPWQCQRSTAWEGLWCGGDMGYCPGSLTCDPVDQRCKGVRLIFPGHSCPTNPDLSKYSVDCNLGLGGCNEASGKCVASQAAHCDRMPCVHDHECDTRMCAFGDSGAGYCIQGLRLLGEECLINEQCVSTVCETQRDGRRVCGGKDCTVHSCSRLEICRMDGAEPSCMSLPHSCAEDEFWDFEDFTCKPKLPPHADCKMDQACAIFENCRYPGGKCAPFFKGQPAPEGTQCWQTSECLEPLVCTPRSPGGDAFCTEPKTAGERCLVSGWQASCGAGLDCRPDPADPSHKTGFCVESATWGAQCASDWGTCGGNHEECLCGRGDCASCSDTRHQPLRTRELYDSFTRPQRDYSAPGRCEQFNERTAELCLRGTAAHRYAGFLSSPMLWGPASLFAILSDASRECHAAEAAVSCCQLCEKLDELDGHASAYAALYERAFFGVVGASYNLFKYADLKCGARPSLRLRPDQCSLDTIIPSAATTVDEFKAQLGCPAEDEADGANQKRIAARGAFGGDRAQALQELREQVEHAMAVADTQLLSDDDKAIARIQLGRVEAGEAAAAKKEGLQKRYEEAKARFQFH